MKCYVSGQNEPVKLYSFGEQVVLPLTQEVFAKFILRAGEDEEHRSIMADIKVMAEDLEAQEREIRAAINDWSDGFKVEGDLAQMQVDYRKNDLALLQRLHDKAISGLRILNDIKREYE